MKMLHAAGLLCAGALSFLISSAQTSPLTPDIPEKFTAPTDHYDYVKRVEMIPMRDGVKLYTVIVIPKGAKRAPMLLSRTPYDAAGRASRTKSRACSPRSGSATMCSPRTATFASIRTCAASTAPRGITS